MRETIHSTKGFDDLKHEELDSQNLPVFESLQRDETELANPVCTQLENAGFDLPTTILIKISVGFLTSCCVRIVRGQQRSEPNL